MMPWGDIQFWLVTSFALWGFCLLFRQILPKRGEDGPACGSCASGAAARAAKSSSSPSSTPQSARLVQLGRESD